MPASTPIGKSVTRRRIVQQIARVIRLVPAPKRPAEPNVEPCQVIHVAFNAYRRGERRGWDSRSIQAVRQSEERKWAK